MVHRTRLTWKEQQNTLESRWLVPVSINGRSPFPFSVEPSRARTLVSSRTIESLKISVDEPPSTLTISKELAFPLVRLDSIAVGDAIVNDFEVVVWGKPVIPPEVWATLDVDMLYPLGSHPSSAIDTIIECRGVLGADFLQNFKVSFDFAGETLLLER